MADRADRGSDRGCRREEIRLLGVVVHALTLEDLQGAIGDAAESGSRLVVGNHNLHSVALHHRDDEMRSFYRRADLVHADGMGLVVWSRILGRPLERRHRVTYVDWIDPLMELCRDRGFRVAFLGGSEGVGDEAGTRLRARHPGLELECRPGYFDLEDRAANRSILGWLRDLGPNLLLVGMGMPRQERWTLRHLEALPACPVLMAGGCMDYVAGVQPTPPRWMGRWGLEWLARLMADPRRLAGRYLLEPWSLLPWMWRDLRGGPRTTA